MIQGIDSKVVMQRSTDYMRENNANVKNAEFAQTMMSKLEKDRKTNEAKSVGDVKKGEQNAVNPDGRNAKQQAEDQLPSRPRVKKPALHEDATKISGNEAVGYEKNNSLDIEV